MAKAKTRRFTVSFTVELEQVPKAKCPRPRSLQRAALVEELEEAVTKMLDDTGAMEMTFLLPGAESVEDLVDIRVREVA